MQNMFRHFWTDERLTVAKKLTMNSIKGFWHPDTFVVNEKKVQTFSYPDDFQTHCQAVLKK
jgi:hypothetical protein